MNITLEKHSSLENASYTFFIKEINSTLEKELENVGEVIVCTETIKSHLEKLKKEYAFSSMDTLRASKYMYLLKDKEQNDIEVQKLEKIRVLIQAKIEDDVKSYDFPKSYKTTLTWKVENKNLQEFINTESDIEEVNKLKFAISKLLPKED